MARRPTPSVPPRAAWSRRRVLGLGAALCVPGRVWSAEGRDALAWNTPSAAKLKAGRAALAERVAAHGGRAAWEALPPLTCTLTHTWSAAGRMWGPPTPESERPPTLTVDFSADKARLDFPNARSSSWGFDSMDGWSAEAGRRTYGSDHHVVRVLPTLKWYAAMPHKLLDPGVRHQVVNGDQQAILVQFGSEGGQTGDTMRAVFVDRRLTTLLHTARGLGTSVRAEARFVRWTEVQGVWIPAEVRVSLLSPAAIRDVQIIRFGDWSMADLPAGFFEKPADSVLPTPTPARGRRPRAQDG